MTTARAVSRETVFLFLLLIVGFCMNNVCARKRGICTWRRLRWKQMSGYDDRRIWQVYSVQDCQRLCLAEERFECRSLQYHSIRNLCRLSRRNTSLVPRHDVTFGFFNSIYEVHCKPVWSQWSSWGGCSTSCGPGFQTRHRECESYDGTGCRSIMVKGDARPCWGDPCLEPSVQHS